MAEDLVVLAGARGLVLFDVVVPIADLGGGQDEAEALLGVAHGAPGAHRLLCALAHTDFEILGRAA